MLRIHTTNVMGVLHVSVHCVNHGDRIGHVLWSGRADSGAECPGHELHLLAGALEQARRAYDRGGWNFTDDC